MASIMNNIDNIVLKYCFKIDSYIDIYLKYMYYVVQNDTRYVRKLHLGVLG